MESVVMLDHTIHFAIDEVNKRRKARGVAFLRYTISDAETQETYELWMERKDIVSNIMRFGRHPALLEGLRFYSHGGKNV